MTGTGVGAPMKRREDMRFLTGQGNYVDDIARPGQVYAYFVRSPHAHAKLGKIDKAATLTAPGVLAVFTGDDVAADKVGGMPCGWVVKGKDGQPNKAPAHPALAQGSVRHVGDPVALVVAESYAQAKDAGEKMAIDYQPLAAVVAGPDALKAGAPLLHADAPDNLCYD